MVDDNDDCEYNCSDIVTMSNMNMAQTQLTQNISS